MCRPMKSQKLRKNYVNCGNYGNYGNSWWQSVLVLAPYRIQSCFLHGVLNSGTRRCVVWWSHCFTANQRSRVQTSGCCRHSGVLCRREILLTLSLVRRKPGAVALPENGTKANGCGASGALDLNDRLLLEGRPIWSARFEVSTESPPPLQAPGGNTLRRSMTRIPVLRQGGGGVHHGTHMVLNGHPGVPLQWMPCGQSG